MVCNLQFLTRNLLTQDAFCLTGSSIVGATVPPIVDVANKPKVATISHLDDLIDKGALLGAGVDSYQIPPKFRKTVTRTVE